MEQTGHYIFEFMKHYGYFVMLPLMIIEGPVATIIAATLAALGAFNVFIVLIFSIFGDVVGDVALYSLGYKWGMGFVRRVGKYIGITEKLVLKMEKYFENHGGKTIFAVKSTTGLCWAAFSAAGIVKMNFRKFIAYSILGGVVWSSFLVAMGYFYGYLWKEISQYINWIGWVIGGVTAASYMLIILFKKKKLKNILINNEK